MTSLRLENFGPMLLVGTMQTYAFVADSRQMTFKIAEQWQKFSAEAWSLPGLAPVLGYGVVFPGSNPGEMQYLCSVAVPEEMAPPAGMILTELPQLTCAVFDHHSSVATISCTLQSIFSTVLPRMGVRPVVGPGVPQHIQRYGDAFDPDTGEGGLEILIPVEG